MVADIAGGEWPQRARNAAKRLTEDAEDEQDDSESVQLLHDVQNIFAGVLQGDFVPTDVLLQHLRGVEESPWREQDLNAHGLGKLLRVFGIRSGRDTTGSKRGYKRGAFADAWERYPQADRDEP